MKTPLNAIVRALRLAVPAEEFHVDAVIERAQRATGLTDMGEEDWQEPLQMLLKGYREEANLTHLGRLMAMTLVQGLLRNRLRTYDRYRRSQLTEVHDPITAPVFILGLPRTGSTLLHELLDQHPRLRAPRFWQTDSLPDGSLRDQGRIAISRTRIALLHAVAPEFPHIHPLGAQRPHECVSIQALALRSMQLHAIHEITSYTRWLAECDWGPAYLWHERYLRLLQSVQSQTNVGVSENASRAPINSPRWLLKAPGHMHGIQALLQRYPSARFVQLHRDPKQTVPSMASLYYTLRNSGSEGVSAAAVGELVKEEWSDGLQRVMQVRNEAEVDARFLDVHFEQLVAEPMAVARSICTFIGEPIEATGLSLMQRYLAKYHAPRENRHRYELAKFELSNATIDAAFARYRARYLPTGQ